MTISEELLVLAHDLGKEERALAILGEGNVSGDLGDGTFLVKASGTSLGTLQESGLSKVSFEKVNAFLAKDGQTEEDVESGLIDSLADPSHKKPSVETFLHALCLQEEGVNFVGHTHTTSVLSILASKEGAKPFAKHLCPDCIVVCGLEVAVIPYVDPGLQLAYAIKNVLADYRAKHGKAPKVILMENHGPVALGKTSKEAFNIMLMLDKWAKLILGAQTMGGLNYMSDEDAQKIDGRLDEAYRRKMLEGK